MTDKEQAFWAEYAEILLNHGVYGKEGEWLVRWAQSFVYSLSECRLKEVDAAYIEQWLAEKGRKAEYEDWQLQQLVSALEFLLKRPTSGVSSEFSTVDLLLQYAAATSDLLSYAFQSASPAGSQPGTLLHRQIQSANLGRSKQSTFEKNRFSAETVPPCLK